MTSNLDWQRLCDVNDIEEDSSKQFSIGATELFLVKKDAQIYAYENRCPHLGIELNWLEDQFLDSDKALIQCATHGALFLIEEGHCVSGPCNGQSLRALPTELRDSQVFVNITVTEPAD